MEENKDITTPQWMLDMEVWWKEDENRRAVFVACMDEKSDFHNSLMGIGLFAVAAMDAMVVENDTAKEMIKAVARLQDNQSERFIFLAHYLDAKKEHGLPCDGIGIDFGNADEHTRKKLKEFFSSIAEKL